MHTKVINWKTMLLIATSLIVTACGGGSDGSSFGAQTYQLTFSSNWNSANFPINYPITSHFSPLIGLTHKSSVSLFKVSSLSSAGVEEVAETGGTNTIRAEIGNIQNLGNSQFLIEGNGIPNGQTQVQLTFQIAEDFPLVSVISMVAPSPDWFVGVDSLNLFRNGQWVDEVVVDVKVYDAGTDDGATFTAADADSLPKANITLLTSNVADTDFLNGVNRSSGLHIGTFTFKIQ